MNIAINNELNEKSMNQISQIIESSSGKDLSSTLLIQQLIQINAVVAAQKTYSKNELTFYYPKSNRGTAGYLSYLFLDSSNNKLDRSYLARHYYRRIASIWIKSIIV